MGQIVVIGEALRIRGFALAGATVLPAGSVGAARERWSSLPEDVEVVLLTPMAREALEEVLNERGTTKLVVTLP